VPERSRLLEDALESFEILRFARRIALAIAGAATLEKPAGSPRLRSFILVNPPSPPCHV
jgi:hypothetical protein